MKILYLLLLIPFSAHAFDWDGKGELSVSGAYRDFAQSGFGPYKYAYESIVLSKYQMRFYVGDGFRFEATPEVRGFVSRVVGRGPGEAGYATVEGPERLLDLDARLADGNTSLWIYDMDRLNMVFSYGALEAQIGRKPVSVGTLKVLPVWNKFSRPLPHTAGPNLVFGSDSGVLRWQSGLWAIQLIDIEGKGAKSRDAVRWAEAILYHPAVELHLMASRWWEKNTVGLALAKDLVGATIRAEGLAIGVDEKGAKREFQAGLGAEYAISETWTLLGEGLFLSEGSSSSASYPLNIPSRFQPLRAKGYFYAQAAAQFASFWNASFAALTNLVDGSFYPMVKVARSLSDNIDISLDGRAPVGKKGKEFSRETFRFNMPFGLPARTIGAPTQVMLQLTASF